MKNALVSGATRLTAANGKIFQLIVIALIFSGLMSACAQIRKVTYPGDFVYLEPKQVTSEMALLSFYMRQIDEILTDDSSISSEQQARIVSILTSINDSADKLGAGNTETNHLVIDDHIDQFQTDVNLALRNASANPPNYFALGKLSGSCVACHKYRKF